MAKVTKGPSRAGEHAAYTFCNAFKSAAPGIRFLPSGGVCLVSNQPHPLGNFAVGFSEDEIENLAIELSGLDAPSSLMFVNGYAETSQTILNSRGYTERQDVPAMEVQIDKLGKAGFAEGYRFDRFTSKDDPGLWSRGLAEGYDLPLGVADYVSPVHIGVDDSPEAKFQFFWVRAGEEVAAVSMLALCEGLAGIYCVAVLPEHRNRGLGAYITAQPLRIAQEIGETVGVLQASTMGYPVYRRLGFEDTGVVSLMMRIP